MSPSPNIVAPLMKEMTEHEVLSYCYAILYSPGYRQRYGNALRDSFPRIPITTSVELRTKLISLGKSLIELHLMEGGVNNSGIATFVGGDESQVEKVTYSQETIWIDKAKTRGFKGVSEEIWSFTSEAIKSAISGSKIVKPKAARILDPAVY